MLRHPFPQPVALLRPSSLWGLLLCAYLLLWAGGASSQESISTIGPTSRIITPQANHRFPDGQTLTFTVEWHLVTAGTATLRVEPASPQRKVTGTADSSGFANVLYTVHDRFEARFDPASFCSVSINKHTEEGPHRRDTRIGFDYSRRKSLLSEKNLKTGESKQAENDIPPCVTDVLSGFYYLASLPLQNGSVYTFPINDGGKTADVTAKVEAREQVKVPAGTFPAVRVSCEAISGPLKGKGRVWVWITDDANRTPVQMRAKLTWGTLLFRLQRISGNG
jgi:Protein of unknown function (DUF3108)